MHAQPHPPDAGCRVQVEADAFPDGGIHPEHPGADIGFDEAAIKAAGPAAGGLEVQPLGTGIINVLHVLRKQGALPDGEFVEHRPVLEVGKRAGIQKVDARGVADRIGGLEGCGFFRHPIEVSNQFLIGAVDDEPDVAPFVDRQPREGDGARHPGRDIENNRGVRGVGKDPPASGGVGTVLGRDNPKSRPVFLREDPHPHAVIRLVRIQLRLVRNLHVILLVAGKTQPLQNPPRDDRNGAEPRPVVHDGAETRVPHRISGDAGRIHGEVDDEVVAKRTRFVSEAGPAGAPLGVIEVRQVPAELVLLVAGNDPARAAPLVDKADLALPRNVRRLREVRLRECRHLAPVGGAHREPHRLHPRDRNVLGANREELRHDVHRDARPSGLEGGLEGPRAEKGPLRIGGGQLEGLHSGRVEALPENQPAEVLRHFPDIGERRGRVDVHGFAHPSEGDLPLVDGGRFDARLAAVADDSRAVDELSRPQAWLLRRGRNTVRAQDLGLGVKDGRPDGHQDQGEESSECVHGFRRRLRSRRRHRGRQLA